MVASNQVGYGELNWDYLPEQQVYLTAEPSLHPRGFFKNKENKSQSDNKPTLGDLKNKDEVQSRGHWGDTTKYSMVL